jgi:hypothetical protein
MFRFKARLRIFVITKFQGQNLRVIFKDKF